MAKKKTTPIKSEQKHQKRPDVKPNEHLFVMDSEEVYSLIQILAFSKDIFLKMSQNCAREGDTNAETVYAARSALSEVLYTKISTVVSIGEPTSRDLH